MITLRYSTDETANLGIARSILKNRLAAIGFPDAVVDIDLARHLMVVRLPGAQMPTRPVAPLFETGKLEFRPVLGAVPYGAPYSPAAQVVSGCGNGKLVTPRSKDNASSPQVILPDKLDRRGHHTVCYLLGPQLLTGEDIGSATQFRDPTNGWQINVHFKNDDFITKVAQPEVNQQVAIVLDGIVESAPTIQSGITGRDVSITGHFTEAEASDLALALRYGSLPIQLDFVSIAPMH
jgi:preprotein translocase subunit SecD